jgi:hypothetical protein
VPGDAQGDVLEIVFSGAADFDILLGHNFLLLCLAIGWKSILSSLGFAEVLAT